MGGSYEYDLSQGLLSRDSMVQQASIVAGYWLLIIHCTGQCTGSVIILLAIAGKNRKESDTFLLEKYKIILRRFP